MISNRSIFCSGLPVVLIPLLFFLWLTPPSLFAQEQVVFEDRFDGTIQPGWSWRRENPAARRFAGGGLEIDVEPYADNEAKNVLVRPFDIRGKGMFRVETKVTCLQSPTNQYLQGGLFWIQNGRVVFKLVHEYVDGKMYIFPGKVPVDSTSVNLRIITNGDDVIAEFCSEGESAYRRIYEGKLERSDSEEIAIQCWHGPAERKGPCWIRFQDFRIVKMGE